MLRGQKHLLKTIKRKKRPTREAGGELEHAPVKAAPGTENIEIGRYGGLVKEVETLKRDKTLLMQQLVDLRHYQQSSNLEVQRLIQRLQVMEQNQKQMMALLAIVVQNPSLLNQLVQQQQQQQQRRKNWCYEDENKKRRFPALEQGPVTDQEISRAGGEIIQYRPPVPETLSQVIADEAAFLLATTQPISSPALNQEIFGAGAEIIQYRPPAPETSSQVIADESLFSATAQPISSPAHNMPMDIDTQTTSDNLNTLGSSGDLFADMPDLDFGDDDFGLLFGDDGEPMLTIQDYDESRQSEQDCQMDAQHNYTNPQYGIP